MNEKNTRATPNWITVQELADRLGCCQQTVRRMAKAGTIPAIKVGIVYRFDLAAVEAALAVKR